MFVRLNVNPNIACAFVYAWSMDSLNPTSYKLWHNSGKASLQEQSISPAVEGDKFLIFQTEIKIEDWAAKIKDSEYNDPKRYSLIKHNCAMAAMFALEIAHIPLKITQAKLSQWKLPLDPSFLFNAVKQDKLDQIDP